MKGVFEERRGEAARGVDEAVDFLAPRDSPVRAVEDGTVANSFLSKAGGINRSTSSTHPSVDLTTTHTGTPIRGGPPRRSARRARRPGRPSRRRRGCGAPHRADQGPGRRDRRPGVAHPAVGRRPARRARSRRRLFHRPALATFNAGQKKLYVDGIADLNRRAARKWKGDAELRRADARRSRTRSSATSRRRRSSRPPASTRSSARSRCRRAAATATTPAGTCSGSRISRDSRRRSATTTPKSTGGG